LVGGDVEISDGWRVGGALGYVDGKTTVDDRSSHANTESYTAALYGGKRWNLGGNSMNLRVGAAYTHHKVDSTRHIDLAGGQSLKADYSVNSMQLFSELGYDVQVNDDTRVGPYAQLAWTSQRAGAFQESGGSGALKGESQRDGVLTSSLGLRGATSFTLYKQPAALRGSLAWVHAAGDVDQRRSLAFIQGQGSNFQISGVPLARDTAALELAAEVKAGEATSFGVGYGGQFGSGLSSHAASLYLQTRF
jgi:outer membrane autotransporter protein